MAAGVTAISLDMLPRTLPRAQPMDALSSQANIAGYKAALIAAAEYGRFFPMLITAAGTARPALQSFNIRLPRPMPHAPVRTVSRIRLRSMACKKLSSLEPAPVSSMV